MSWIGMRVESRRAEEAQRPGMHKGRYGSGEGDEEYRMLGSAAVGYRPRVGIRTFVGFAAVREAWGGGDRRGVRDRIRDGGRHPGSGTRSNPDTCAREASYLASLGHGLRVDPMGWWLDAKEGRSSEVDRKNRLLGPKQALLLPQRSRSALQPQQASDPTRCDRISRRSD